MIEQISRRGLVGAGTMVAALIAQGAAAAPGESPGFKTIGFSRPRSGMTIEAFRNHYETVHAPLALQIFPSIRRYTRNYVTFDKARMPVGAAPADFGWACLTEMWFNNAAGYDAFLARLRDPEVLRVMQEDEAKFVDPASVWKLIVNEFTSTVGG